MTDRGGGGDGRFIDGGLGSLSGEAAGQRVERPREGFPTQPADLPHRVPAPPDAAGGWRPQRPRRAPSEADAETPGSGDDLPTYYDRPVIKEPVWIWTIPAYFYVGGTSAAAAALAAAALALDRDRLLGLVRRGRVTAAAFGALGTVFLIVDLGRPERFLNMLRVFRPTSPMSVGSWILAAATSNTSLSALLAWTERSPLRRLGDAAGTSGAIFGLGLAAYPGALLGNTAVPVWLALHRHLPPLFVASAASGAASFLDLFAGSEREEKVVHAFGLAGKAAVLAGMAATERAANRVERVGRPLREGLSGALWQAAKVATVVGLAVSLVPSRGRRPKALRLASAVAGTAGALALRWAVVRAGHASARDPRATFVQQRGGGGERGGS